MTAVSLPRLSLEEFFLEVSLTNRKHLVVEGRVDERFMRAWVHTLPGAPNIVVSPVENLELNFSQLASYGLTDSARSRVVVVALRADEQKIDIRCVADRDAGHSVRDHSYSTLLWTDYPALESYALHGDTLSLANLHAFDEQLPAGRILVQDLSGPLRDLFAVRCRHPNLRRPNYAAGVKTKGSLSGFDVSRTVAPEIRAAMSTYPRSKALDPRMFAYGHDIGGLLMAAYGNKLKNRAGLATVEAVESALRSALHVSGYFASETLFRSLSDWFDL